MKTTLTIALALLFCSACSDSTTEAENQDLLKTQREAMEKAKAVEEELQKTLEERMKDVDQ